MEFGKVMPAIYQVRNLGARLQLPGALLSATSGKAWKQRRAAPEQLSKRALQHRTVRTSVADAPTPSAAAVGSVGALNAFGHILGNAQLPPIENETYKHYAPGSRERAALKAELEALKSQFPVRVPCVVNGKEYFDDAEPVEQVMPHDHRRVIALYRPLDGQLVQKAIQGALEARERWSRTPADERAAIFLKAAELASQKYRYRLNAATMFGQSKNVWQAEIDAAVETIDFWRFGVKYMREIYNMQPPEHFPRGVWNRLEWRPLEGFVAAISPFNFTAIGANLPSSPAIMGNVALWKPSPNTELSSWFVYQVLREAGLPEGVIQFLPGDGPSFSRACLQHPALAGVHFTGSTRTFRTIWQQVASNLPHYRNYPRIVGETGGKNFHFVHPSADLDWVVPHTIRGAFEYQGQKCSATSRLYVPSSLWPTLRDRLVREMQQIKQGPVEDFSIFMSAVINRQAFERIRNYIEQARTASQQMNPVAKIIHGGSCDDRVGYFIQPTLIETRDPDFVTMREEIFGPVLTVYVYRDTEMESALDHALYGTDYALTGAIFARERSAVMALTDRLRDAAGNFYINDKCTGSIVGQQPFGGARQSGTNDKSGSVLNLLRWTSARAIKESFLPPDDWRYPHMMEP
ncbi:1-pyrroline-5-carboxylate dehydrogenase [Cyanidioschyzon merolae strain 10D]|jgi:1-pyrroline-5-carboxylate dehydrogenase|uniref:Multifunctional fusion protein n=1 Tax=Cyanidioschyzon merolae (strain NIES-3377 / 10D) TaxID=280699 RepID=M1V4V6_CYAM1|nr:1-pyrroline-5-carboxylate dehydrogenase [Cyanidioschyzon merolae strain 10D]BAM79695.1 1-pyrroline-5-carboxylate dehydrogenase [Cyanidioschyzon merolae strain 10D]|eukprot:XP_005535981.1 1-pyrroline-5-carboxylate dehydrogenase [Cyanidioschyzon merolae strain 10D]